LPAIFNLHGNKLTRAGFRKCTLPGAIEFHYRATHMQPHSALYMYARRLSLTCNYVSKQLNGSKLVFGTEATLS